ncbi:acyl--CoA ligase [Pantoea sp. Ap-967]|uniref:class I adenylate-forming enzyme family protein n=1 Tax=Pantoea sp. Ap-967 TaxID=2608362 RepID=UPI00141DE106|nr:class I adenylate-forming enzyme family protein [Pantoea sp. Ap-967]NIE72950.1 acyl--CoA ligase [Pantoea sp. Ap-967]
MTNLVHARLNPHPSFAAIEQTVFPASIPAVLDRAAQRFGDAPAIDFFERGESLSFTALRDTSHKLASALHRLGVKQGTHVALLISNRIEYPVAWLALGILGAVAVPVVTGSTARELKFIFQDANIEFLVVEDTYLATALEAEAGVDPGKLVLVGEEQAGFQAYSSLLSAGDSGFTPVNSIEGGQLMNIQYTSGTTGLPKGVMQDHRFWVLAGAIPALMLPNLQSVLSDHPWYYIDPQWMLMTGLYSGARVDFSNGMSVRKFLGWLESRESSLVWFPDPLLKLPETEQDSKNQVQLFMGYHLSTDMQAAIQRRYQAPVREFYGMTEIALGICVPLDCDDPEAIGSCGVPGPFRRARIVDGQGNDVQPGQVGELWITGDGIFSGYYNRPEINAELLVDGWFRTGDLFCQDEKGYFHIVGRIKDMIKRSGENIAALEVEQVLMDLAGIEEAAVVAVPDTDRDQEVKAYVKLARGFTQESVGLSDIHAHCAGLLAKFKIPRYIQYVEEFIYTPSNKVAKHLLVKGVDDLRINSYDFVDKIWR